MDHFIDKINQMKWLLFTLGVGLIGLAVLAYQLGIDHSPDWGSSRFAIFVAGLISVATGLAIHKWKSFLQWKNESTVFQQCEKLKRQVEQNSIIQKLSKSRMTGWFTQPGTTTVFWMTIIIVFAGWVTAWWMITAGQMGEIPGISTYFDRQAEAFLNGQLSLLETPDPRLAELQNPYDYRAREEIPIIWDATYYGGKYYLYWGPVPALLASAIKVVHPGEVNDSGLTLIFVLGIMAAQGWLINTAYKYWFPRLPAGLAIPPLITAVFSAPLLWLLARPSVYEAAIAGGQFFWLTGLALAFIGLKSEHNKPLLALTAGLSWAASIGCRANLAIPILVTFAGMAVVFLRNPAIRKSILVAGIAFALGVGGLGYFNFARFGSITETGHKYQLTGPTALVLVEGKIFSGNYIIPNFYNNFLRPPQIDAEYPFIHAPWITESMWPFFIRLPNFYYYSEPITGLLFVSPFVLLIAGFCLIRKVHPQVWILLGATTASILTGLCFIATFMRYLLDFSPGLILLATLGYWIGSEKQVFGWNTLGVLTAIISLIMGILLALAGPNNNFLNFNPALFQWMTGFFGK